MTYVPLPELPEFARNVRAVLKLLPREPRAVVVFLQGELGAGKTTFVQAMAREYDIPEAVQSPTYTLMRSYDIPQGNGRTSFGQSRRYKKLVHIDAYRLEKPEEWKALKPAQFLGQEGTVVFIEWPERIAGVGPKPDLVLDFSAQDTGADARQITMEEGEA